MLSCVMSNVVHLSTMTNKWCTCRKFSLHLMMTRLFESDDKLSGDMCSIVSIAGGHSTFYSTCMDKKYARTVHWHRMYNILTSAARHSALCPISRIASICCPPGWIDCNLSFRMLNSLFVNSISLLSLLSLLFIEHSPSFGNRLGGRGIFSI